MRFSFCLFTGSMPETYSATSSNASSGFASKRLRASVRDLRSAAISSVPAFPTESHTTFGGGPDRNARCRKSSLSPGR